jgi:hypothetical protein
MEGEGNLMIHRTKKYRDRLGMAKLKNSDEFLSLSLPLL